MAPGTPGSNRSNMSKSASRLKPEEVLDQLNNTRSASRKLKLQDAFFQFLYVLVKQKTVWKPTTVKVVVLRFLVDILIAFQAAFDDDIPWGSTVGDGVRDFFYYITYPAIWLRRSWFVPTFVVVALTMSMLTLAAILTVRAFHLGKVVPIGLLKSIISLHAIITTLYMPMLQMVLIPLNCALLNKYETVVEQCWGWPGVLMPLISLSLLSLFVPYTLTMGLMYFDARPNTKRPLAMANGRVEELYILCRMAIVVVFMLGSCETGAVCIVSPKVVVLLLIGVAMLSATALTQPFLHGKVNHARSAIFALLSWTTLLALVSAIIDNRENNVPGYIWIAGILPAFLSGYYFSSKREKKYTAIGRGIAAGTLSHKFNFAAEVDLSIRHLDSQKDKKTVIRYAMIQYPQNGYLPALLANALSFSADDVDSDSMLTYDRIEEITDVLEQSHLLKCPVDVRFLIYTVRSRLQMYNLQRQGMHRMNSREALLRLSLQTDMIEARTNHESAVRTLISFWKNLLLEDVELERLPEEGERLHEASVKADNAYRRLLNHYRDDVALHYAYASFIETVLLDAPRAEYYRGLVHQMEIEEVLQKAERSRSIREKLGGTAGAGRSSNGDTGSNAPSTKQVSEGQTTGTGNTKTNKALRSGGAGASKKSSAITRLLINTRIAFVLLLGLMILSFAQKEILQTQQDGLVSAMSNGERLRTASQGVCVDVYRYTQESSRTRYWNETDGVRAQLRRDLDALDTARMIQTIGDGSKGASRYAAQDTVNRLPSINVVERFPAIPPFFRQTVRNLWDALGLLILMSNRVIYMSPEEVSSNPRETAFVATNCPRSILFGLDQSQAEYVSEGESITSVALIATSSIAIANCIIIIAVGFFLFYKTFSQISRERTMVLNLFLHIPRSTVVVLLRNIRETIQSGIVSHTAASSVTSKRGGRKNSLAGPNFFDDAQAHHLTDELTGLGDASPGNSRNGSRSSREQGRARRVRRLGGGVEGSSSRDPSSLGSSQFFRNGGSSRALEIDDVDAIQAREERRQELQMLKVQTRSMRRTYQIGLIISAILVLSIAASVGVTIWDLQSSGDLPQIMQDRSRIRELSRTARANSDYLTSECRNFAQFGNLKHYENYWNLIHSGDREKVQDEMRILGISPKEQELLGESKSASDALVRTETISFVLAMQGFGIDPARMADVAGFVWNRTEELSDLDNWQRNDQRYRRHGGFTYTSRANDSTLPPELQRDIARAILYDAKYNADKSRIMTPVLEPFQTSITNRYHGLIEDAQANASVRKILAIGLAAVALLSLGAMFFLIFRTSSSSAVYDRIWRQRKYRIPLLFSALIVCALVVASIASLSVSFQWSQRIKTRYDLRDKQMDLAFIAAANSDFLTDEVRRFSQVGDYVAYSDYWELIFSGRREAVQDELVLLGITKEEEDLIALSKANSDALIFTETVAMALIRNAFNIPDSLVSDALAGFDYTNPDTSISPNSTCIQDSLSLPHDADKYCYVNAAFDKTLPANVQHHIARAILFDQKYDDDKDIIMEPLARFRSLMRSRLQRGVDAAQSSEETNLIISLAAACAAVLAASFLAYLTLEGLQRATKEYSERREATLGHAAQTVNLPLLRQLSIRYVAALSIVFVIVVTVFVIVLVSVQGGRNLPSTLKVAGERNSLAKKVHFLSRSLINRNQQPQLQREMATVLDRMEEIQRDLQFGSSDGNLANMYDDQIQQDILTATPCFNTPSVCANDSIVYHGLGDLYDDYIAAGRLLLFQKEANVPISFDHPSIKYITIAEPHHLSPGLSRSFNRIVSRADDKTMALRTATRAIFALSIVVIFGEYLFIFAAMLRSLRAEESRTKAMMGLIPEDVVGQVEVIREYLRPE